MVRLLVALVIAATLEVGSASSVAAEVTVYRFENFTSGHTIDHTVRCLKEITYSYSGECCHSCHHGEDTCCGPCTKQGTLNDELRAIEITGSEQVEVYEHCGFEGWHLVFRGPGRWVFPAGYWDKASAVAIY